MSTAEIKKTKAGLIEWINELTDANVLMAIENLRQTSKGDDWWDDLSDAYKNQINKGIADADAGRVVSSEEFWRRVKNS